jgi:hypothetical protein
MNNEYSIYTELKLIKYRNAQSKDHSFFWNLKDKTVSPTFLYIEEANDWLERKLNGTENSSDNAIGQIQKHSS